MRSMMRSLWSERSGHDPIQGSCKHKETNVFVERPLKARSERKWWDNLYATLEEKMYVKWMWACPQTIWNFVEGQVYWAARKKVKFVFLVCWKSILTKFYGERKRQKGWREGYIAKHAWWTSVLPIASRGRIPVVVVELRPVSCRVEVVMH